MDKNSNRMVTTSVILLLLALFLVTSFAYTGRAIEQNKKPLETLSIPPFENPTANYWETSEYMIGSIAVSVILPESDGTNDTSTEDWVIGEIQEVNDTIYYVKDWWEFQNPDANVSFVIDFHANVSTEYEPINWPLDQRGVWIGNIMSSWGFENDNYLLQVYDYVNNLKDILETDWAFVIFVVDSSNDTDGNFEGGGAPLSEYGGPSVYETYDKLCTHEWGAKMCAHEIAHIFMAIDEKGGNPVPAGYLNVTSIPESGCLMDVGNNWCLSNGTWGQIGWNDSDNDGIQDVVDTFPKVYLDNSERVDNIFNYTGLAVVTPYPNHNPWDGHPPWGYQRNVTINKIQNIQYKIDDEDWTNATITYSYKQTIVNFTFTTDPLPPGEYNITVRATNQWGNSGYANETVVLPYEVHDIAITNVTTSKTIVCHGYTMSINVTIENKGNVSDSFDVTVYANTTPVQTQNIFLENGTKATQTFIWNTSGFERYKNYTISANATLPMDVNTTDNTLIGDSVTVVIPGDIDADEDVDIFDIVKIASAYGSEQGEPEYFDNGDINNDRNIDIFDIVAAAGHYGESW